MKTYRLTIVFTGVDFDDDEIFDALADVAGLVWRTRGEEAFALATVDAVSALAAAESVVGGVIDVVPSARPLRTDLDLVAIPDIARRIGVTREAVRNWANGARQANFPVPQGVVGDGIKVWRWADVNAWLKAHLDVGDLGVFPTNRENVEIDQWIADTFLAGCVAAGSGS